jgi:hypothetical protein
MRIPREQIIERIEFDELEGIGVVRLWGWTGTIKDKPRNFIERGDRYCRLSAHGIAELRRNNRNI